LWLGLAARALLLITILVVVSVAAGRARRNALIAYIEKYGESPQARLIDVDRGRDRMIENYVACQVDWLRDGETILVTRTFYGEAHQVIGVPIWRGDTRVLTSGGFSNEAPSASPDGRSIAYAANRGRANTLYLIDVGSGDVRPLAEIPLWVNSTRWSPDGASVIAVGIQDNSRAGAYAVDLTNGMVAALDPSVGVALPSPDGERLALVEASDGGMALRVSDGTAVITLADGFRDIEQVAWSSDGTLIAFSAQAYVPGLSFDRLTPYNLYVIGRDGGDLRMIRRGFGAYMNNFSHFCAVAWSP
jgi:Tol biopolymer transport system component